MRQPTNTRYALLIFDWDGTLSDSAAHIVQCMQQSIAAVGAPARSDAAIRAIIGLGLYEAIVQLFPEETPHVHQALMAAYRAEYLQHSHTPMPLFPGTQTVLQQLRASGYDLAIATGKSRRGLDRELQQLGLVDYFGITRCADETFSKPHPLMLEEILTDYNLDATQALMIGDTEYDMRMAHNIGMDALAVVYGVHSREQLLALEPKGCLAALTELPQWLDNNR